MTVDKLVNMIVKIVLVGYIIISLNTVLLNYSGLSVIDVSYYAWRGRSARIVDVSSFTPLAILFSWNAFLIGKKRKIIYVFILLIGVIYAERTRALFIAIVGAMIIMYLLKNRNTMNQALLLVLCIFSIGLITASGISDLFFSQFSVENNGVSTLNRLSEYSYYLDKFVNSKIFGIGVLTNERFINAMGVSPVIFNAEDIGIVGLLGNYGITSVSLFIIPVSRWIYIVGKKKDDCSLRLLFIGFIVYAIFTSPTLIMTNFQRIPLFVFVYTMFEYYYISNRGIVGKAISLVKP